MDAFLVQAVDHRFHRNIAGQIPQLLLSPLSCIHMAEQAVKHHMQIGTVDAYTALFIEV